MRIREALVFFMLAALLSAAQSCARPDTQDSYLKAAQSSAGVYGFEFEMADSLASYDFWIYSRTEKAAIENLELRVLWISPSGESFRETVYMEEVGRQGNKELYRSDIVPAEYGKWKINIRAVPEDSGISGLGMICKSNFDGTR